MAPTILYPLLLAAAPVSAPAMPAPVDRASGEHYVWGDVNDGWHLVKRPDLSVIEEQIAPGAREVRHLHAKARQFFYVLSGMLTMEADGRVVTVTAGQGIEIPPGTPHQARNDSTAPLVILVTSAPPSHGDRVAAPLP
ncbi:mannose-6-phosphate isomerase-like protein (cupin superfamily) [Sphingobium sp. OAS761]|uniref:cupin domain-containing protein n=1 Tax=Sphingobium sp. OAS761 TaxID=2817901 RepID=UPI00209DBEFF|nr:cupin domain-containing protein [Sphingobium sp. OAS761]MCP1471364.1 mannose-6-phosphate isomerase-like protein (cupin superfamily) [Sphingobium sp. OAS761]